MLGPSRSVYRELDLGSDDEALKSQVACAVLGLLIEKPTYGYDVWRRYGLRFGKFLPVGKTVIYSTLSQFETTGLVEKMGGRRSRGVPGGAKPGPSYRVTVRGARAYKRRVTERIQDGPHRGEISGQMVLAGIAGIEAALEFLDRYEEECLLELQRMEPASNEPLQEMSEISRAVERLNAEAHRREIDARLKWIAYARAELRACAARRSLAGDGSHAKEGVR